MKTRSILVSVVCLAILMAAYASGFNMVEQRRASLRVQYQTPQGMLAGHLAQWVAGEYKGLLADYLLLEAGSFIGSNQDGMIDDWQNIYLALKQSLALDPYFMQSYLYAQGNLPWEARMAKETIGLLEIAAEHRFWDWRPGYYVGFNYYYFLNDYAMAGKRFLEAAKVPNSPVLLAILGGRMSMKGDQTMTAVALLKSMLDNPQLDIEHREEILWRIQALQGVMALEEAVNQYHLKFEAYPDNLAELVEKRIISSLPDNPYGESYRYNPQTGRVAFDKVR